MRTSEEILKIFKENNITGYQIERDLAISQVGADKFLNGETRQPFKKTLEMYNSYIDNNFLPLNKEIGYSKQTQLRVKSGVSLEAVKEIFGHSDTKITEIYAKIIKVMRFDEAKAVDGKFE